jgi:hypothetical protein
MAFNVLELHWKIAAITTITTNSYNMSDFELQALQQYSYNISDLELLAVSYNSRQVVLQPNPSAATTFQAISYNSRKVGGGGCTHVAGNRSPSTTVLIVGHGTR